MTARVSPSPTVLAGERVAAAEPRRHLYQVDVVRLLTFVGVVGVHAVTSTMNPDDVVTGAGVSLLHFTRGTFFLLSAFVLTYAQGEGRVRLRRFWPRRFYLVGVPYLVWTVVYWWVALDAVPRTTDLPQLGRELLTGTGDYHLYFLLVSMQLYLLFPFLLWLVRRTRGHHPALLVVSGAVQLVLLAVTHYLTWPGGWSTLQANALSLAPAYQLYFVVGAVAAVHRERLHAWVVTHTATVVALLLATAGLHIAVFLVQLPSSGSVAHAYDPLQPSLVPWTLAVTLGLYAAGCRYAARRRADSRRARFVEQASLASFGVFLVHPLVLNTVLGPWLAWGHSTLNPTLSGALAWAGTLVVSFGVAVLVIRTPLALPRAGRRRLPLPSRRSPGHV